jgi:hypothetical protein
VERGDGGKVERGDAGGRVEDSDDERGDGGQEWLAFVKRYQPQYVVQEACPVPVSPHLLVAPFHSSRYGALLQVQAVDLKGMLSCSCLSSVGPLV